MLSTGMQIMAPPSVHPSGRHYRWLTAWDPLPLLFPGLLQALPLPPEPLCGSLRRWQSRGTVLLTPLRWSPGRPSWSPTAGSLCANRATGISGVAGQRARDGISATTLVMSFTASRVVPCFRPQQGYSKFQVYAVLEHGGNLSQAARHLRAPKGGLPNAIQSG